MRGYGPAALALTFPFAWRTGPSLSRGERDSLGYFAAAAKARKSISESAIR